MTLSLAHILTEAARRHPARTAVVCQDGHITYAELCEQALAYAASLRERGVAPGDRVAVLMPNVPDFPRVYYALAALGAAIVPVPALLTGEEIAHILNDSRCRLLVCAEQLLPAGTAGAQSADVPVLPVTELAATSADPLPGVAETAPDDPAVILYTSGTTGQPKGAVLTHLNLVMNASVCAFDTLGLRDDDVLLGCLPLFHSFGQTCAMNAGFRTGATLVLMPQFDGAAALDLLMQHDVSVFLGVPTMYTALLAAADSDPRRPQLRLAVSGGAALPATVLEQFAETFGGPISEGYGLSETSPAATFNQETFGRRAGTVGHPIWGVDVRVADPAVADRVILLPGGEVGEVVIRGHNVFAGYLGRPEATSEALVDGWFRTGDLGRLDDDGFLSIVDRKKDMVIRGGYNVYPREVEETLLRHPAIDQVAVIGIPHDKLGEEVVAVVVPSSETDVDAANIIDWAQTRLAKYKYPREIRFVDALPVGPSGKVLKRALANA